MKVGRAGIPRAAYYMEQEYGGYAVYPRDLQEFAIHAGGPIEIVDTQEQAREVIRRLTVKKRADPTPEPR